MRRLLSAIFAIWIVMAPPVGADPLWGFGRLVSNDALGDGQDRWRSGSVSSSWIWGPDWQGNDALDFGELLELRFHTEIVAPSNLVRPGSRDRAYGGILSLGLHSHYKTNGAEVALGADLVLTGPQTGLGEFHSWFHDLLNAPPPSLATLAGQIGDDVHAQAVVEMAYPVALGAAAELRPFAEARYGFEDLARVGFDISMGTVTTRELLVREPVTGQRYRVVQSGAGGMTAVLGADIAAVGHSELLIAPVAALGQRGRVRAGLHWATGRGLSGFYGVSWLSPEFSGQSEGQLIGSAALHFAF